MISGKPNPRAWIAACTLALCASSCAKLGLESESLLNSSCQAAPDQRGSFMAKVPSFPLEVTADSDFTPAERDSIGAAVSRWNALGQRLIGGDFYTLDYGPVPDAARGGNPRDCNDDLGASRSHFYIVHERSTSHWQSLGFSDRIPGATIRCHDELLVDHQVVFVNTALIEDSQVTSVVIHELGHALGLDHSCADGAGNADFRGCAGLPEGHSYRIAVMYPTLRARASSVEGPEIKDYLQSNDVLRAQCLYFNP